MARSPLDIAEALKKEGLDIDRKRIVLDEPIKRLGDYTVPSRFLLTLPAG